MSDHLKLYAAHALSPKRFILAFHELDNENMKSIVLEYDGTRETKWSETEIPRNIMDICEYTPPGMSEGYALMSDEGDIYTVSDLHIGSYKIPGAGLYSKDADGKYGACTAIENIDGELFITGLGSQLYKGHPEASWLHIEDEELQPERGYRKLMLMGLAVSAPENLYIIAEGTPSLEARPDLEAQIQAAKKARDKEEFRRLNGIARSEWRSPIGQILHWDGTAWDSFDMHEDIIPSCIYMERANKVWVGMSDGTVHVGNAEEGFDEIAEMDGTIFGITKIRDKIVFSSGYGLFQAQDIEGTDAHELNVKSLKPKMEGSPLAMKLQTVDDVMFLFDAARGAYIWDSENTWTHIEIPDEIFSKMYGD